MEDFAMTRAYKKRSYRVWSVEEKRSAVARMDGMTHVVLAAGLGIEKRQLYAWRRELRRLEEKALGVQNRERSRLQVLERENVRLKQALATKVLEADFLSGVLRRIEAQRRPSSGSGETASTRRSV
jgi:transposase-like protein